MGTSRESASLGDYLFALPQYLIPQHTVSRLVLRVTRCRAAWLKNALMKWFIKRFKVDMREAEQADYREFACFNDFFTRSLKPGVRPIVTGETVLACPVDGAVSQAGRIQGDTIFQAKGHDYSVTTLLGGDAQLAQQFAGGHFATLYLSPRDYHRIHMPIAGSLTQMIYVPGRLFSVNPQTVRCIPGLFARNERVAAIFDTAYGAMALVLVGAINVASIETVWHGVVTPPPRKGVERWTYAAPSPSFVKGEEMGRFNMGSTVVCLFANPQLQFDAAIAPAAAVRMGCRLASI